MNPMFKRAVGMLGQRAGGGAKPPSTGGPMVQPKAPAGMGGGLMERLRGRVRGKPTRTPGGPIAMKRPPGAI